VLENHGPGNRAVHIPQQVFKQEEFFRPQVDFLAQPSGSAPNQIQLEIAGAELIDRAGRGGTGGCATQAYGEAKAHGHLRCEERLAHVIIHTRLEQG
jgi:hypothetical protein